MKLKQVNETDSSAITAVRFENHFGLESLSIWQC